MLVKTGEKKYAGTDANVFAILYGEKDDTGKLNQQRDWKVAKYMNSSHYVLELYSLYMFKSVILRV